MVEQRGVARDLAIRMAGHLREPEVVARAAEENWLASPGWGHASLAYGHPGIALLFAELAHCDSGYVVAARNHLAAAVRHADLGNLGGGLFGGFAGLGLAAQATARSPRECTSIIAECSRQTALAAGTLAEHLRSGPDRLSFDKLDVITGLTGMARYLLRHKGPLDADVRSATAALANFGCGRSERHRPAGRSDSADELSDWLVTGWLAPTVADPESDVHLNLGLAHGIAGPLAFLAIAWMAGVRVPGMTAAIDRMARWLAGWYRRGHTGSNWPPAVSVSEQHRGGAARAGDPLAWCYGTPGVARSLQLASVALGNRRWALIANEAMLSAVAVMLTTTTVSDVAMCHGWTGVLTVGRLLCASDPDPVLEAAVDTVAARIIAAYCPAEEFGYRFLSPLDARPAYEPGLLGGAAGVALALWTYGTGVRSTVEWEDAFVLT